jgi:tetratricopeptide (TPR) repeat protein
MDQEPDLRRIVVAAANLSAAGDHDEALRVLETAGREGLSHPVARNVAGDIYLMQGKKREALKAFDTAVKNAPAYPEAHCNRGVALQQLGRLEEAVAAFDRALKLRPSYAIAHFNRGNALRDLHRDADAVSAYDRAIALNADFAEAYLNRGVARRRLGEATGALDDFDRALRLRTKYNEAEIGRIEALRDLDRHREALESAERFLLKEPDSPIVLAVKTTALVKLNRKDEALAAADELVGRYPDEAPAHGARSAVLRDLTRAEEALSEAREAARLAPRMPEPQLEMALCLLDLGKHAEALASLEKAERLGARWRDLAGGRAQALTQLGRKEEAAAIHRKLIAAFPGDAMIAYNGALHQLAQGDYAEGFRNYERRLDEGGISRTALDELAPRWRGEPLAGRKLLVYGEQGLGDAIQFARYLPRAAESGAEISLKVSKPLQRLFRGVAKGMAMIDAVGALRVDAQVSIMSLAHVFGTRVETVPPAPYLSAEPALVAKWRERIGPTGFRIGVVWQGSTGYKADRVRSLPLARLAPLAALSGVRLISLQAINGLDQLDSLPEGMRVERLGPEASDPSDGLAEVAAVTESLDLVLGIDSGVAHLAGALGRPVWTLLRDQPEWRWIDGRTDTPWYGSMRLFRQKKLGDWDPVIAEVVEAVAELLGGRGG